MTRPSVSLRVALVAACAVSTATAAPNMNGDYSINPTPNAGDPSKFPTSYEDYPGGAEFFDIYSLPITSTYGEIFYTTMDPVPIPPEIVKRFDGKAMAIIGLEQDQVRRTSEGDVSVPINVAYNHHYGTNIRGKDAMRIQVDPDDPRAIAAHKGQHPPPMNSEGKIWVMEDLDPSSEWPNYQGFYTSNGGEARSSFKGFAPGFARMIMSPTEFTIQAMQIDTWNRDKMNVTGSPFVAGPLPKNAVSPEGAQYSGLLECPLTTRVTKIIPGAYAVVVTGDCGLELTSEVECHAAAMQFAPQGYSINITTVTTSDLPAGCSASLVGKQLVVHFNTAKGGLCGQHVTGMYGSQSSLVNVSVSLDQASAASTISLTGPDGLWFGVGFGAKTMSDAPWAIIVDGYGNVTERKLANYAKGSLLPPSVTVVSNTVTNGNRTVTLTRSLVGKVFSFDLQTTQIPFINAVGSGPDLDHHDSKSVSTLAMLAEGAGAASCICALTPEPFGQGNGMLSYEGRQQVDFHYNCHGEVLATRNPTCDIRTYVGGLQTCLHGWHLLDAEQEIPWQDQPLVYQLKYRFWFQEYNPTWVTQQPSIAVWLMGSFVGEYDIPKCPAGSPGCNGGVHTLTDTYLVPEENTYLIAMHNHCHSASCISIQVFYNDTGELLCEQRSHFGDGSGKFEEPEYISRPPCLWGPAEFGLEPPPLIGGRMLYSVALTNSTYAHHGDMAIPTFFTVAEPLQ